MKYEDAVQKLTSGGKIYLSDITCAEFFMLLRDRIIKTVEIESNIYEINIIKLRAAEEKTTIEYIIIPDDYHTTRSFTPIARKVFETWENNGVTYISIRDEHYKVIFDILETMK